jgi:hypothetical protein
MLYCEHRYGSVNNIFRARSPEERASSVRGGLVKRDHVASSK